jgi:hypothetical protein
MPGDWPLHRSHICRTMEETTLAKVGKAWGVDHSQLWEEVDDFPETVYMKEPCKLGECLHALTPRQADRYGTITQEFKLALRHSGHPALAPLLFELRCGLEVRYCLIGDNEWTHELHCDFLCADIVPQKGRRLHVPLPFEVVLQRETASGQECEEGWPRIRSEKMFILNLVTFSADPWHIYALHAGPDQPFSYNVTAKIKLDAEAMREADVIRLEGEYALRLLKKITEPVVDPKFKKGHKHRKGRGKGKGKGEGKGRGRGRGRGDGGEDTDSVQTSAEEGPSSAEEALVDQPADEHVPGPRVRGRRDAIGFPWGRGEWTLAPLRDSAKNIIGYCGNCNGHHDALRPQIVCKKQVTIGQSGLTHQTLKLRMKRWIIAGIDDDDWDVSVGAAKHIGLGKAHFLADFADGLSEEECDRIANGVAPA